MFDTYKVICKDAKHFERAVCPAVTNLKGISYPLPFEGRYEPGVGHYLVMLPFKVLEEELTKLQLIDNLSIWVNLHKWKE